MEDRETPRMRKYGESKTTRIMMATVPRVTSGSGLRKFQADGILFDRVYHSHFIMKCHIKNRSPPNHVITVHFPENFSCYSCIAECPYFDMFVNKICLLQLPT